MQHRIRLSDADIDLITAALAARRAMRRSEAGRRELDNLIARLDNCAPGNPALLRSGECIHGVPLADLCEKCRARTLRHVRLDRDVAPPTSRDFVAEADFDRYYAAAQKLVAERYGSPPKTD